jgi:hypothetical protein
VDVCFTAPRFAEGYSGRFRVIKFCATASLRELFEEDEQRYYSQCAWYVL